jgi:hypothetical protein
MDKVAEMFGVEIGEKFIIKNGYGVIGGEENPQKYYLDENGYLHCTKTGYPVRSNLLSCLLADKTYEIVKLPWKPKTGNKYCFIGTSGVIHSTTWINCAADIALYAMGNCFRTKAEAEAHKPEILQKMKEVMGE